MLANRPPSILPASSLLQNNCSRDRIHHFLSCSGVETQVSSRCLSRANNTHQFNPSPSAREVWAEIAGAARPHHHRETKMDTQRNQARHRCSGLLLKDHVPLCCKLPPSSVCRGERNTTRGLSKVELVLPALPPGTCIAVGWAHEGTSAQHHVRSSSSPEPAPTRSNARSKLTQG